MKKLLMLFATALALLAGFSAALTARYVSTQVPASPAPEIAVSPSAVDRLARAIRIPTISGEDPAAFRCGAFPAISHVRGDFVSTGALATAA